MCFQAHRVVSPGKGKEVGDQEEREGEPSGGAGAQKLISLLGMLTSVGVVCGVVMVWASKLGHEGRTDELLLATFPEAVGVLLLSFSAHAVLPSYQQDMAEPARFEAVLGWAFASILAVNLAIAAAGYRRGSGASFGDPLLYAAYGSSVAALVTTNIMATYDRQVVWQRVVACLITGLVAFKAYCSCIPIVSIIAEWCIGLAGLPQGGRRLGLSPAHVRRYGSLSRAEAALLPLLVAAAFAAMCAV
eukprot:gene12070-1565_t